MACGHRALDLVVKTRGAFWAVGTGRSANGGLKCGALRFRTEPVDAQALAGKTEPLLP